MNIKRFIVTLIILVFSLYKASLCQDELTRIQSAYQKGEISLHEKIVKEGYVLFPEREEVPPGEEITTKPEITCGTGIIAGLKTHWDILTPEEKEYFSQFLQRTEMQFQYVTPEGNFRIHYNTIGLNAIPLEDENNNDIYDFVEVLAEAFEHSLSFYVDTLGYKPPPSDNGIHGEEYDIYIDALGYGEYGYTDLESEIPGTSAWTSYIKINSKFNYGQYTTGHDGLRVTAAHELHHAIQLGYTARYSDWYFYEITAVWFEDVVYDDINDYLQYLPSLFDNLDRPFNYSNGRHEYGMGIWLHFLSKRYDRDITREIWETMTRRASIGAMDETLRAKGSTFYEEFSRFALWNYYTGSRADTVDFYEEGKTYPEVKINNSFSTSSDTSFSENLKYLSSHYCNVDAPVMSNFQLAARDEYDLYDIWSIWLVHDDGDMMTTNHKFNFDNQSVSYLSITGYSEYSRLVFIPTVLEQISNTSSSDGHYYINFNISLTEPVELKKNILSGNFPNPFLPDEGSYLKIPFILRERTDVEIRIFNSGGRLIRTLFYESLEQGVYREFCKWDGNDEEGNPASTGVYVCHMKTVSNSDMDKFILVRE